MNPQDFYRAQSKLSDPGAFAPLFDALPYDLDSLCSVVRGIYVHYMSGRIDKARTPEVDLRYIHAILERGQALDSRPLSAARTRPKKVVGCCRDAALLLCSMLRHKGIPARVRVGFATYIKVGLGLKPLKLDHAVTEYWDGTRWKLVDAEQDDALVKHNGIDFDVHDIPRDRFLVGGRAWQMARHEGVNPDLFCGGPDDFFKGLWAIRNRMLGDLSAPNKTELLLWDSWGWMEYDFKPREADNARFDHIAELTQRGDEAFDEIRALGEKHPFKAPPVVMCYSPAAKWKQVAVEL